MLIRCLVSVSALLRRREERIISRILVVVAVTIVVMVIVVVLVGVIAGTVELRVISVSIMTLILAQVTG